MNKRTITSKNYNVFLSPIRFCSPKGFVPPELEWITDSYAIYMYSDKKKEKPHWFRIYKVYRKHIGPLVLTVMAWKSGKRCTEKGTEHVHLQCMQHSTKRPHWLLAQTSFWQNRQDDHNSFSTLTILSWKILHGAMKKSRISTIHEKWKAGKIRAEKCASLIKERQYHQRQKNDCAE